MKQGKRGYFAEGDSARRPDARAKTLGGDRPVCRFGKEKTASHGHRAITDARRTEQGESPALKLMHILCYDLSAIRGQRSRLVKQKTGARKLFPFFLF